uniref:NADH dehydrogenase subunit 5 n=1 Tax=Otobius lagophilus TaxID=2944767 RepID=UPI0022390264|nr:NADH dehydrogenase subunit 5 [Otobius lagophilus]UYB78386.1 NADH dehydrogenase subunit 5 [Otobius lagophilus]UYB78399.1 NADH dehydrogenase subunit 5 [Otobius lagophilus]UYL27139.1 NADH dehydrogenase subunit 5 [Otobius lagophilus]
MFVYWGLLLLLLSFLFFFFGLLSLFYMNVVLLEYIFWEVGGVEVKFFMLFDWMSLLFLFVVMFISSMVMVYSDGYMEGDYCKEYFLYGVLLFVGSMVLMVVSPNLLMILLGWDGLGLVSYCLVIYYQNEKSDSAGMMTVLSNRVGDVMILLSMVMLFNFGSLDFFVYNKMICFVGFFLIVAGMTKSAQIPFSAWLPAAMAAPTPVSSLVHSSTLVTAGVYLLIRLSFLFQIKIYSSFLLYFSMLTMIMSGIGAMLEMDLKRVIALSTLSQLGLMMMILSIGVIDLSFFHLLTHAIFKAMLFLCAGVMIHNSLGSQDLRMMGAFFRTNPMISGAFGLASLSLFGFPFLSGFYSKDLILEYVYVCEESMMVLGLIIIATIFTCLYSLRLMYYSIWSGLLGGSVLSFPFSFRMGVPILIMGVVVVYFGSFMMWLIFPEPFILFMSWKVSMLNLLILLFSFWLFFLGFFESKLFSKNWKLDFFGSMWFLALMTSYFPNSVLKSSLVLAKMDLGWLEEIGPQGVYKVNVEMTKLIQWFQMSSIYFFLLFMVIFMVLSI